MKSAIFQDSRGPSESRGLKKPLLKRKGRSQSPFIASTGPSNANWNLEDMITSYISSGVLPTLLSPSLPPRFGVAKEDKTDVSDTEMRENEYMNDSDIETIPMSLLSPTLPNIFNEPKPAPIAHPVPKKANDLTMDLDNKFKSKRVRWIDQSRLEKPRFLLRVNLDTSRDKYRSAFLARSVLKSPVKLPMKPLHKLGQSQTNQSLPGLAIYESRKTRDVEEAHPKAEVKQDQKSKSSSKKPLPPKQNYTPVSNGTPPSTAPEEKKYWSQIARDLKTRHERLGSKDPLFSILIQLDYLECMSIFCDVDDAKNLAKNMTPNEENWQNLLGEIVSFVNRLERYIKTNNVSDKKKAYFSFIVGILAMHKASILRRLNQNLECIIKSLAVTKDSEAATQYKVIETQGQIIRNHQKIEDHCREAQSFFGKCPSTSTVFPKSWSRRVPTSSRGSTAVTNPNLDNYYLPLGPYSEFRETSAFLYNCVREFSEIYSHEINGGLRYSFCSGQSAHASLKTEN